MRLGKKCFHAVNAKRREVSLDVEIMEVKFHVQFPLEPATQSVALIPARGPIMDHFPFRQTFELGIFVSTAGKSILNLVNW